MTPTPTTTSEWGNASMSLTDGFASTTGLGGIVALTMYIVVAILAVAVLAPWLAQYRLPTRLARAFGSSVEYAIKGLATTAALAITAAPVYLLATTNGETQRNVGLVIGGLVAAYISLVAIGWLADQAFQRFIDAHPEFDSWDDMWETPEDADVEDVEVSD